MFIWVGVGLGILVLIILITSSKKSKEAQIFTKVQKGEFEIVVSVTGELEAMNKENIVAPPELMSDMIRLYNVKIQDLVPEGSMVDSGEWVATLDKTDITTRLREVQDELDRQKTNFTKVQLDTTIQLRDLRDQIQNLQSEVEERRIALEQSQYEPPATIRQAQINLEKSKRAFENAKKNYFLRVQQAEANMKEADYNLQKPQMRINEIMKVTDKFEIAAPKKGMVIYVKERRGEKRKIGSTVSPWDASVATLPDLSVMISRTYVSEVDINQVRIDQKVRLGVDAFPDRKYTGQVIKVSNVGEQLQGSDSKVFEVVIRIDGTDPILRPYMTTSNAIIINHYKDVFSVPLETIHSEDSIPFVYKRNGTRQIVLLGAMNDNQVIIEKGLNVDEDLYLGVPEKAEKYKKVGKELIPLVKAKEAKKRKEKEDLEKMAKEQNEQMKRNARMNNSFPAPGFSGKPQMKSTPGRM